MKIAALPFCGNTYYYEYSSRENLKALPRISRDVVRNCSPNFVTYYLLLPEGILEAKIPHAMVPRFAEWSVQTLVRHMVAVFRAEEKRRRGYTLKLYAPPCFLEDGVIFTESDILIRNKVKTMR